MVERETPRQNHGPPARYNRGIYLFYRGSDGNNYVETAPIGYAMCNKRTAEIEVVVYALFKQWYKPEDSEGLENKEYSSKFDYICRKFLSGAIDMD